MTKQWDFGDDDVFGQKRQGGFFDSLKTHTEISGTPSYGRCYESHKPLALGDGLVVHGGSCITPCITDADIYIGFDYSMYRNPKSFPWHEQKVTDIYFPIRDMKAPDDPKEFKAMVHWVAGQIKAGKKVHAGCIGGHGRTGTFLAALVKVMMGEQDAITYVRTHYCKKAVESSVQVNFLNKFFGIDKAEATKSAFAVYSGGSAKGKGKKASVSKHDAYLPEDPWPEGGKSRSVEKRYLA
jgi:protein-tyrosine phosphatase